MMTPAGPGARAPVPDLQARLADVARQETREWWTRYLKGTAQFRGVPMPVIRRVVTRWAVDHGLVHRPDTELLALTDTLLRQPDTEDKLAAMLLINEVLLPAGRLGWESAMPAWAAAFAEGAVADWNACDWFAVKVLGPMIERDGEPCARAVAGWIDADGLWQRRASAVAFVKLVAGEEVFAGQTELVLANCARLVESPERFAQTAAGWVLRELSRAQPERVEAFLDDHGPRLSREALKKATAHLN